MYRDGVDIEVQGFTGDQPGGNEILNDLLLTVDHHGMTRQLLKVDPVTATGKVQEDALMKQPFLHHARAHARIIQDIHALVLEHAGPHSAFDVMSALGLQYDTLDAVLMQEVSQQQAGRARADDRNLCTHER